MFGYKRRCFPAIVCVTRSSSFGAVKVNRFIPRDDHVLSLPIHRRAIQPAANLVQNPCFPSLGGNLGRKNSVCRNNEDSRRIRTMPL